MPKENIKKKNSHYFGYYFFRGILTFLGYLAFGGKVINKEKITTNERLILAGNHVGYFDAYLLMSATKRPLHFLGKKELFSNFITKWFFNTMHLIPVDRKKKNPEARQKSLELLKENKILCIFPEGTFHKEDILLPFKTGAVDFAIKSHSKIIPFAIIGNYKFRSNPKLIIGDPIDVTDMDIESANAFLEKTVKELIINNNK